jgi:hypothetical protein
VVITALLPDDFKRALLESQIRQQQGIPSDMSLDDASKNAKYDYNGFINAALAGDERAQTAVNPSDGMIHFPDPWKAEDHPTHLWKTREDYATQAQYAPLTDQAYANSFSAMSQDDPVYQRMIQLEQQTPDYGIGGGDSQKMYTNLLYSLAKGS